MEASHPEATCQDCGGPNIVWFGPNEVWNRVMPDEGGILCPICFVRRAERAGIGTKAAWRVAPTSAGETEPEDEERLTRYDRLRLLVSLPFDDAALHYFTRQDATLLDRLLREHHALVNALATPTKEA